MLAALRGAAHTTRKSFRAFSSTTSLANATKKDAESFRLLRNMVNAAAQNSQSATFIQNPNSQYRSFEYNTFITPDRLKYNNVLKTERRHLTRPKVGPSKREARKADPFYQLNIDPLDMALNPFVLNNYVSDMGKIYGRNVTNLTMKNQRRLGKAIRRAKMMGVIPVLSKRNILQNGVSNYRG
ncbi:hypothetical protein E1B28_004195 [Marasmius oreades]|uniref:Small ribosomal subunit protein bS18m n=1 Tax=Marasmius oreades TaxID=181124 RepID=A0A9P7UY71_9AGAR|nr:uncharacterized protein E1B28_004195 [Marasmius oreades]KAG7096785.1 hypothetical protein E1B28_004195 [Marasmius oreades]